MIATSGTIGLVLWFFGYHYYNCGKKLGYFIREERMPATLERNHRILLWTGIFFAYLCPSLYGLITTYRYY